MENGELIRSLQNKINGLKFSINYNNERMIEKQKEADEYKRLMEISEFELPMYERELQKLVGNEF